MVPLLERLYAHGMTEAQYRDDELLASMVDATGAGVAVVVNEALRRIMREVRRGG